MWGHSGDHSGRHSLRKLARTAGGRRTVGEEGVGALRSKNHISALSYQVNAHIDPWKGSREPTRRRRTPPPTRQPGIPFALPSHIFIRPQSAAMVPRRGGSSNIVSRTEPSPKARVQGYGRDAALPGAPRPRHSAARAGPRLNGNGQLRLAEVLLGDGCCQAQSTADQLTRSGKALDGSAQRRQSRRERARAWQAGRRWGARAAARNGAMQEAGTVARAGKGATAQDRWQEVRCNGQGRFVCTAVERCCTYRDRPLASSLAPRRHGEWRRRRRNVRLKWLRVGGGLRKPLGRLCWRWSGGNR